MEPQLDPALSAGACRVYQRAIARLVCAVVLGLVVTTAWLAGTAERVVRAQDDEEPDPPRVLEPLPAAVREWVDRVRGREPLAITEADAIRVNLLASDDGRTVLYQVVTYPDPADDDDADDADSDIDANGRPQWRPRYSVVEDSGADYTLYATTLTGDSRELLACGPAENRFYLLDGGARAVCLRRLTDTTGDGEVTRDDAASLWVVDVDSAESREVYPATDGLALCGVLPVLGEALIGLPTASPFERSILRLPLDPEVAAGPVAVGTGCWVECVESDDRAVLIARVGADASAADDPSRFIPWLSPRGNRGGPPFVRPMEHVRIELATGLEQRILSGEDWYRLSFIEDTTIYFETLALTPPTFRGEPLIRSIHTLAMFDMESRARVPITSDLSADHAFVGAIPGRGIAYVQTTFFNRKLMIYVEGAQHALVKKITPFSQELTLVAGGRSASPALFYLRVTDSNEDGHFESWRDESAIHVVPLD